MLGRKQSKEAILRRRLKFGNDPLDAGFRRSVLEHVVAGADSGANANRDIHLGKQRSSLANVKTIPADP